MRWCDITFNVESGDAVPIAVVHVRKATKTGKNRSVQCQHQANATLIQWRQTTTFQQNNDLVFFGQSRASTDQVRFTDLNKSFQTFLERCPYENRDRGLLFSKENEKRSIYSLRHTYATSRINAAVNIYDLSLNLGCKVQQIERHYSHSNSDQRRFAITKSSSTPASTSTTPTAPPASKPPLEDLVSNAIAAFDTDQIDTATLVSILTAKKHSRNKCNK